MMEALLALIAGLLIGSFLNVCIYRMTREDGLSIVSPPRSICPACQHTIAWYDNVPVVSFAVLRGRCRHCGAAISPRYPAVEVLTGLLFFASVFTYGISWRSLKLCTFSALVIGLVFSDLEQRILPDELTSWRSCSCLRTGGRGRSR
jgi:leader peptidase (prepilin peptidase)/N-methyltransferase